MYEIQIMLQSVHEVVFNGKHNLCLKTHETNKM